MLESGEHLFLNDFAPMCNRKKLSKRLIRQADSTRYGDFIKADSVEFSIVVGDSTSVLLFAVKSKGITENDSDYVEFSQSVGA